MGLVEKPKGEPMDYGSTTSGGQHERYPILPDADRQKGFVRPVRQSYRHQTCGQVTTMALKLAETYAADPDYYGATFCTACRAHFPVAQFVWTDDGSVVGS